MINHAALQHRQIAALVQILMHRIAARENHAVEQDHVARIELGAFEEPPPYDAPMPTEYPESAGAPDEGPPSPPAPAALLTPADWPDEAPPPVDWLADGRIPRGDVTTLQDSTVMDLISQGMKAGKADD